MALAASLVGAPARAEVRFLAPVLAQLGHGAAPNQQGGVGPRWNLAFGDLDGDGIVDAVSPLLDSLGIYRGHGDGTFAPPLRVASPGQTDRPAVADFDGDGALDIAYGGRHQVAILFGDGSGQHWSFVSLATADTWSSVLAGDFDGDGKTDILTTSVDAGGTRWLRTYLGRAGRTFEVHSEAQQSIYEDPLSLHACDMNEDGRADVVLGPGYSLAQVWISDGDGTFTKSASFPSSWGVEVGDLTGDGHADLVTTQAGFALFMYPGHGDGTFGAEQMIDFSPLFYVIDAAIGDLNGDGIADVVVGTTSGDLIATALGLGSGAFGAPRLISVGSVWHPIQLADLDGDERLDYVGLTDDALVTALGDGAGGLRRSPPIVLPVVGSGFVCADLDRDSTMDLVIMDRTTTPNQLLVELGRSGRSFVEAQRLPLTNLNGVLTAGDVDGDGIVDVIAENTAAQGIFCRGRGDGTLDSISTFALPGLSASLTVGDVTSDGHSDLVYMAGTTIRVLPGDGAGGFGPPLDSPLPGGSYGLYVSQLVFGDVNGDGLLDAGLVDVNSVSTSYSYRCLGDGTGHFAAFEVGSFDFGVQAGIAYGDVNGDGRDDIVTFAGCSYYCHWTGGLATRLQKPDGTLDAPVSSLASTWYGVLLGDADLDGHPDAVTSGTSGPMIGFGDGTGSFGRSEGYGGGGGTLAFADFDGDGRPDLLTYQGFVPAHYVVLYGREFVPPVVELLAPEGGHYGAGAHVRIEWHATDDVAMGTVDVFVSRHGRRGPFAKIASDQPPSGSYLWPVSGAPSDSVAFKVVARDAADNVAWTVSDSLSHISSILAVSGNTPSLFAHVFIRSVLPNPVHDRLRVDFSLPTAGDVVLSLHDVSGRRLAVLAQGRQPAGRSVIEADMPRLNGAIHPGVLFLRLSTGNEVAVARVTVLR